MERLVRAHIRADPEAGPVIAVYQAFNHAIADWALAHGALSGPNFSLTRMTWIKPSFFWMAYRCGWAAKPDQERALKIWLRRAAFEGFLARAALSHYDPELHYSREAWKSARRASLVRAQWDPERSPTLGALSGRRALQLGLSGRTVRDYVGGAIVAIEDVTPDMRRFAAMDADARRIEGAVIQAREKVLRLPPALARGIGADPTAAGS